jgi:hypothetical protein
MSIAESVVEGFVLNPNPHPASALTTL